MSGQETETDVLDRLQELESRLQMAEAESKRKDEELRLSHQELESAGTEIQSCRTQVDRYAAELERVKLQFELEKHHALESLREEHAGQLKFLQTQTEREHERTDSWIAELRERMERENQGYVEWIHTLVSELFQQQICAKPHDPYSCSDSEAVTNPGLQYSAGSRVDPCSVDNLCTEGASGAQTISGERESLSMLPSQAIVPQITESRQMYLFTQEHGAPFLKGCTPESKQPKNKHVHVH